MTLGGNDTARAFYIETLGLVEITPPEVLGTEKFVWLSVGEGGHEIHMFTEDPHDKSPGLHVCIQVDDQQAVREKLEQAGYETSDTDVIPNRPRFFTRDPFENRVEITEINGAYSQAFRPDERTPVAPVEWRNV
jgi:catechol 2,3-dioxygenase-like lactoylglutathione lyase family enzyme